MPSRRAQQFLFDRVKPKHPSEQFAVLLLPMGQVPIDWPYLERSHVEVTFLCSPLATKVKENKKRSQKQGSSRTANSILNCYAYRQWGKTCQQWKQQTASLQQMSRYLYQYWATGRIFHTHTRHFPHNFLPATSAAIHTMPVSFFADEERQRLDELQVQARAVFFRRNSTLGYCFAHISWDTPLSPPGNRIFLLNTCFQRKNDWHCIFAYIKAAGNR